MGLSVLTSICVGGQFQVDPSCNLHLVLSCEMIWKLMIAEINRKMGP